MNISQHNKQALKNPWVLGMLLFLLTFLTANVVFIYLAFKSPPNLVVKDFYERGKVYVETHERIIEQEKSLGWNGNLMLPAQTRVNQTQTFETLIQGKNSTNLILDSVVLHAYRPSDARADFAVEMLSQGPGRYASDITFTLPGIWDVIVVAKQGEQEFVITKRINISP